MSLKDWMKRVETLQLDETIQTVMLPAAQSGSSTPAKPVAAAIDNSTPQGKALAGALGVMPGSSIPVAPSLKSPIKIVEPAASTVTQPTGQVQPGQSLQEEDIDGMMSSQSPPTMNKALAQILGNHPHEHKMCQEGWGMDNSLYEALCDHYFKEGRIPRSKWHGSAEDLRHHVEECYAKDTGMGGNQAAINSGMLDEEGVAEGERMKTASGMYRDQHTGVAYSKPTGQDGYDSYMTPAYMLDQYKKRLAQIAAGPYKRPKEVAQLQSRIAKLEKQGVAEDSLNEKMSSLERSLRQSTKENDMFESKFTKLSKKLDKQPGITDPDALAASIGRKKLGQKEMTRRSVAARTDETADLPGNQDKLDVAPPKGKLTKADFSELRGKKKVEEATKETPKGKIHTADAGGYGRKHEDDEDDNGKKPKKPAVKKGRGRPKKDSDSDTGEVMKPDFSAFGVNHGKDIKLKPWPKDKTITKKIATKADREEVDEASPSPAAAAKGKPVKKPVTPFTAKKKDAQMESWDRQLKGMLTEGLTVTTSVGQESGQDSVSITASDEDAHKLLQILQNAGLGTGVPSHATQSALSTAVQPAQTATAPSQSSTGGSATDDNVETPAGNVSSMPMPRGMAFSVQPEETEIPTEPIDVSIADSEDVIDALGKDHADSSKSDNGDDALAFLKKAIGHGTEYADGKQEVTTDNTPTPASKETSGTAASAYDEVEESDEEEDDDTIPDDGYADGGEPYDDEEMKLIHKEKKQSSDKVEEGQQKCNECGGLMEDEFHECDSQLNEWANSPDGQSEDEQFKTDMDFMTKVLSGGINGQKSTGQTTGPIIASQTNRQGVSEGYNISVAEMMRKLANIK